LAEFILYVEIEDLAVRAILLQAPVAIDLRFLLTVLRVVPEMERSHDLVVELASRASRIHGEDLPPKVARAAGQMADLAAVMWWQAAGAWGERDRSAAAGLGRPALRWTSCMPSWQRRSSPRVCL
jgi:phosphate transport system protein